MIKWRNLLISKSYISFKIKWLLVWLALSACLLSGCGLTAASNNEGVANSTHTPENEFSREEIPSPNSNDPIDVYETSNLPQNILTVLPWPREIITLAEYNSLAETTQAASKIPSVCIGIQPTLEPEYFFTSPEEWFVQETTLIIDGEIIPNYNELIVTDAPESNVYSNNGSSGPVIVAFVPAGSPYFVCYPATLGVGKHTATFRYQNPSGKLFDYWGEPTEYTWEFVIK